MQGGGLGMYHDLHEPQPALRYKISGGSPAGCYDHTGSSDCVVGTAGSPDGIHNWTSVTALRFPRPWRPDCHTNLFFDEPTGRYIMTTRDYLRDVGRTISLAESGGASGGGSGKYWKGNWTKMYTNESPSKSTPAGDPVTLPLSPNDTFVSRCGQHCRDTANCTFFETYTSVYTKGEGQCLGKATASAAPVPNACKPPACESGFFKMDGSPVSPGPSPPPPPGAQRFGNWSNPQIVEKGVNAHQLYSQITWRFYDIMLGIVMVFDATNGNTGPAAGHVHCMLSFSTDNASTWDWVDPKGLDGLTEFIPAGKLGSFESHVCFAAHTPLRMGDGSTRVYCASRHD